MKTASAITGTFFCSEGAAARCSVHRVKADFAAQRIRFSSLQYVTVKPIERTTPRVRARGGRVQIRGGGGEAGRRSRNTPTTPSIRLRQNIDVAGQILPQACGQTFIEQAAHSGGWWGFPQHGIGGFFEKRDGLLARDRGKITEKNIKAVTCLDVVKKRAHGNTRAGKARLAAHDFRVNYHDGLLFHADNYTHPCANDNPSIPERGP